MAINATIRALLFKALCLSAALFLLAAQPSYATAAEPRPRAEVQKEFDITFQQMLANPADVTTTMHYAKLAVELGDYESAIPPLERILMYNPRLPEIRLEVGILYYLLNSHTIAKQYLTEVKNDKNAPPELVSKADQYLAKM